jgi:hypothetical protein
MTSGKLTPKADDALRKKLTRRAKEHVALADHIVPDRLLKTPSQKRSENIKKKMRNRDGFKVPDTFKEPEVMKDETETEQTQNPR